MGVERFRRIFPAVVDGEETELEAEPFLSLLYKTAEVQ